MVNNLWWFGVCFEFYGILKRFFCGRYWESVRCGVFDGLAIFLFIVFTCLSIRLVSSPSPILRYLGAVQ